MCVYVCVCACGIGRVNVRKGTPGKTEWPSGSVSPGPKTSLC